MIEIPPRAIVLRKECLKKLEKSDKELAKLLAFSKPHGETDKICIYGPYFDFESLQEVSNRLCKCGLEYWDDFIELKEDMPDWMLLGIVE